MSPIPADHGNNFGAVLTGAMVVPRICFRLHWPSECDPTGAKAKCLSKLPTGLGIDRVNVRGLTATSNCSPASSCGRTKTHAGALFVFYFNEVKYSLEFGARSLFPLLLGEGSGERGGSMFPSPVGGERG